MEKLAFLIWMMGFPFIIVLSKRLFIAGCKEVNWKSIEQYSLLEAAIWIIVGYNLWHV